MGLSTEMSMQRGSGTDLDISELALRPFIDDISRPVAGSGSCGIQLRSGNRGPYRDPVVVRISLSLLAVGPDS